MYQAILSFRFYVNALGFQAINNIKELSINDDKKKYIIKIKEDLL